MPAKTAASCGKLTVSHRTRAHRFALHAVLALKRRASVAAVFVLLLAPHAAAHYWELVGESGFMQHFVDTTSFSREGSLVQCLYKMVLKDPDSELASVLSFVELDCEARKSRTLQATESRQDGSVHTVTVQSSWMDISPASPLNRVLSQSCQ
jgi:hypothetical protein